MTDSVVVDLPVVFTLSAIPRDVDFSETRWTKGSGQSRHRALSSMNLYISMF